MKTAFQPTRRAASLSPTGELMREQTADGSYAVGFCLSCLSASRTVPGFACVALVPYRDKCESSVTGMPICDPQPVKPLSILFGKEVQSN